MHFELICYDNLEYVDDDWVKQFLFSHWQITRKKHNNNRLNLTTLIAK